MGNNRVGTGRHSQTILWVITLALLGFAVDTARAGVLNSCTTYCHGMPPRDSFRKGNPHFNSQSSAFLGNHRSHLPAAPVAADCTVCHTSVAPTDFGHENEVIAMVNSLKGYSTATIRARYDKGRFINLTSIPNLTNATCSNVSCHFEAKTPVWNSAAYSAPANCNACHGSPPAGSAVAPAGGLAGSHARHDTYFPGTVGCQKCHPGYAGFTHASSAGRPLKVQGFLRDPLNTLEAGGTYSGTGLNYLPSKSSAQLFGSCNIIYCHSSAQGTTGTGVVTYQPATWGGSALTCGSCHKNMATDASATGSHAAHAQNSGTVYTCDICHGAGSGAAAVNVATHVNKLINLAFSGNATGTTYVSKGTAFVPGSAVYSSCATSNCHGAMNAVWGANTAKTRCQKCHGFRSEPWNALNGATSSINAKAGVHFAHISSAGVLKYAKPFSCAECHLTSISLSTDNVNAAGHFDTAGPAEIFYSTLANTKLSSPTYTAPVCAANYCHGANMNSNVSNPPASRIASPSWNAPFLGGASSVGNGTTTPGSGDCATCHGYPPMTATHAGRIATSCTGCHGHVNAGGTGFTNASRHVNGVVEASGAHNVSYSGSLHLTAAGTTPWAGCVNASCHSNTAGGVYPAPVAGSAPNCSGCHINGLRVPSGTSSCWDCHGVSAINGTPNGNTFPNISGNHRIHVAITGTTCATCHTGGGTGAATHGSSNRIAATPASVRVVFTGQGTAPLWTFASKTCSATNCHGLGTPVWGARAGAPVNGFPYSAVQCAKCHSGNLASDVTAANPFYATPIPKVTLNTNVKVGAHTSHITSTDSLSNPVNCVDCHGSVTLTAATHMNGTTNFTWNTLATKGGTLTPTYTAATRVCANVYCHGASMSGGDTSGTNRTPTWNVAFLSATLSRAACASCHGFPPPTTSGHPAVTLPASWPAVGAATGALGTTCSCHANISSTGTTYATIFVNKALHIDGTLQVSGGTCIGCHASAQTGTHGTPRDAVMTEFGLAWGHKKAGRAAVTDADCIVCHLEGEFATKAASATKHMDGNIDLRDPDGVGEVAITNISGTTFTFTKFATSYAAGSRTTTGHLSNTDIANVISLKFCIKCHDANGATNSTARSGTAPTQYLPFGTGSQNSAAYTVGLSAGVVGGVVNVDSMFATTNSTVHPVKGPQNNRYASGTRMAAPYGVTKTAIADGIVMNCFDCHNAPTPLTSRTVASHGSTAPNAYRGTVYDTTNSLCKVCHSGYTGTTSHHGTGSAFASNTNSGMTTYLTNQCQRCHASTNTAVRPVRSEDAHGFNRFAGTGTDALWPRGATETYRPYSFIRNTTQWSTTSWKPLSGPGVPAGTATCGGNMSSSGCGDNMTTYSPGGTF